VIDAGAWAAARNQRPIAGSSMTISAPIGRADALEQSDTERMRYKGRPSRRRIEAKFLHCVGSEIPGTGFGTRLREGRQPVHHQTAESGAVSIYALARGATIAPRDRPEGDVV